MLLSAVTKHCAAPTKPIQLVYFSCLNSPSTGSLVLMLVLMMGFSNSRLTGINRDDY